MSTIKTFLYSFTRSLFEPRYYKDVEKSNFWFSFKYLWFLLFILTFLKFFTLGASYLKSRPYIKPELNKIMGYAQNFYPNDLELKIKKGQLSTNVKEPYIFDLEKNKWQVNRHLLIIDTKGSIDDYPNYNAYILATRNAVVYPSKSGKVEQTSVFYFHDLKQDFGLNRKVYDNFLDVIRPYTNNALSFVDLVILSLSPLCLVFGPLFWTAGVMIGLVFLTFFVWIISLIFKKDYGYGSLYRMGMHAVTWPLLTNEIFGYLKSPFPRFYSWIFLFWMMIILFSDKKSPKKRKV